MKPTAKEVEDAIDDLHDAMIECVKADDALENANLRKIKAHKALSMARDTIRTIRFN